ncbi:MAG: hypothetical protein ACRD5L_18430 [Bryobacteraceae bacterium]
MSFAVSKDFTWLLLLIPLGIVFAVGVMFAFHAWNQRRWWNRDSYDRLAATSLLTERASLLERPSRWLAVKSNNPAAVQAALNLNHPVPCSWEDGVAEGGEGTLFVSPPLGGWVLVVGAGLPEPLDDVDFCYQFLRSLSRKLGNVQYYSVNRALSHH